MRIVPQFDTYPRLVNFGQSASGKAVLLGVFALGLVAGHERLWVEMTAAVALMTYFPAQRRLIASCGALYWLIFHGEWLQWGFLRDVAQAEGQRTDWTLTVLVYGILAAVFFVIGLFFRRVSMRPGSLPTKRPVLFLTAGFALLLAAAALLPIGGMTRVLLWGAVVVMANYLWYFAYALKDAAARTPDGPLLQLGTLRPFWGDSPLPFTKGAAYLRKIEAHTPRDLSITQLKAIKLLIWVAILHGLEQALHVFVYGDPLTKRFWFIGHGDWIAPNLGVPTLQAAILTPALPLPMAWASLIAHFAGALVGIAGYSDLLIACCRMAGFDALRGSYRPLQSQSLGEFWNRYNFYFKELMVEFFFFPVFTRYFKSYRRIRLLAATTAAETLGNMVFHFFRDFRFVADMGLWPALVGFQVYTVYATILGLAIGISQLRDPGRDRPGSDARTWRRVLASAGVLSFFCLLEIFDQEGRSYGLGVYWSFLLRLFLIRN